MERGKLFRNFKMFIKNPLLVSSSQPSLKVKTILLWPTALAEINILNNNFVVKNLVSPIFCPVRVGEKKFEKA